MADYNLTGFDFTTSFLNETSTTESSHKIHSTRDFYIGLFLACSSSAFIGASFIFKKKGLLNLSVRAGAGGMGYLKEPMWWIGMVLLAAGETANFIAYAFAPASLVTPLGALSVIVAALLASYFLNERLNLFGKVGCGLCVVGSTIIVIHSPEEQQITKMQDLALKLIDPGVVIYITLAGIASLVMIFYYAPRLGQTNILVYIIICSIVGSFTVMGCKAIGLAFIQTFSGDNQFTYWLTYFFIMQLAVCMGVEMIYLNRALDTFNTSMVTPIYYVLFTTFVLFASAIIFKEWGNLSSKDVIGNLCGFVIVVGGIFLLNAFRDMAVAWKDVSAAVKQSKMEKKSPPDTPPVSSIDTTQLIEGNSDEQEYTNPVENGDSNGETIATSVT